MRARTVPDDKTLRRLFLKHRTESARWIRDEYGWPCSVSTVQNHRRRLRRANPIRGAATLSDDEFRATVAAYQDARFG